MSVRLGDWRHAPISLRRSSLLAMVLLITAACAAPPPSPATLTPTVGRIVFATDVPSPTLIRFPVDAGSVTPTLARVAVLTPGATRATTAVAADLETPTAVSYVAHTDGQGATMRRTPGGDSLGLVIEGAVVTLTGREEQAEGQTWKEAKASDGRVGWIDDQFIAMDVSTPGRPGSQPTATPRMAIPVIPTVTHAVIVPTLPRTPTPVRSPLVPRPALSPAPTRTPTPTPQI